MSRGVFPLSVVDGHWPALLSYVPALPSRLLPGAEPDVQKEKGAHAIVFFRKVGLGYPKWEDL